MTKIQEIHKTTARYITLTLLFLSLFSAPIVQAQVRGTETIIVYRYEKFSAKQINSSMAYLRNFYSKVKYGGELTLPEKARYVPKGCYTATLLLNYQKAKKDKDNVVIAFTDKDICETKKTDGKVLNHYRCMGMSYLNSGLSVVTTSRFKMFSQDHLNRLMLHELGHAFGLKHCAVSTCIMQDAKGKNKFGHTPTFCTNCKKYLKGKGWNL